MSNNHCPETCPHCQRRRRLEEKVKFEMLMEENKEMDLYYYAYLAVWLVFIVYSGYHLIKNWICV